MLPATIVLGRIPGLVGKLVWLGQAINGDRSYWTHAGITTGDRNVFEARPGGAGTSSLGVGETWHTWDSVYWDLTYEQRVKIVEECHKRLGTGYNWTTYFYLAAYRLNLPLTTRLLRKRVARSDKMICSQIVDEIYRVCGIQLFDDGRLPHDVTPGDLARLRDRRV